MEGSDIYRASNSLRGSLRGSLRSGSASLWRNNAAAEGFSRSSRDEDDEEALKWAALEKLPTVARLRKGILTSSQGGANEIDVHDLGWQEKRILLERLVNVAEEDNEKFLLKLKNRIDRIFQGILHDIGLLSSRKKQLTILKDVKMLSELARREKQANIKPDPDLDVFMKAAATEGQETNVTTDYILKMASGLFRFIAATGRNMIVANTFGSFALLITFVLGGFVLSKDDIKKWWIWGYYISPMMYGQNAMLVNELLGHQWSKPLPNETEAAGLTILKSRNFPTDPNWFWIGVGGLVGFILVFNLCYTLALSFLKPFEKAQAVISEEPENKEVGLGAGNIQLSSYEDRSDDVRRSISSKSSSMTEATASAIANKKRGMVLPFEPHSLTFDNVVYSVDMPQLFLMKRGGQEIYVGPLGHHSKHLIKRNKALIQDLSKAAPGTKELYFPTQYSQSFSTQTLACLWKQHWSYWRNPPYTAVRLLFTIVIALIFGTMFWDLGGKTSRKQDLANAYGSMYAAVLFIGIQNVMSVQPVVAVERTVFYRERAAGMYSAMPYAVAQLLIEIPYILVQTVVYGVIVYAMIGFQWDVAKFFWYIFFMYFTLLYFTYYGMMAVAITPNHHIASIVSAFFYGVWNLFSGFIVPRPSIPIWWRWYYWGCPTSWTLYGLVTSQFGDIKVPFDGDTQTVQEYLKSYFGFEHDFLGVVAGVIVGIAVLFAAIFVVSIKAFNFQRRLGSPKSPPIFPEGLLNPRKKYPFFSPVELGEKFPSAVKLPLAMPLSAVLLRFLPFLQSAYPLHLERFMRLKTERIMWSQLGKNHYFWNFLRMEIPPPPTSN
ncbi:ABC-2 type transporter [Corchorus olitorius]|uniref:ABC-2 type transporter n=1 Tax=Corchorus olitorius TaxID=93759 RepID=A0A1R3JZB0_9ROSI|nr:ABC-2 type transporter [Corchorus olitorius]